MKRVKHVANATENGKIYLGDVVMEKAELVNQLYELLKKKPYCKVKRFKRSEVITNYIRNREMMHCMLSGQANLVHYTRSGEEQFVEKYHRYDFFSESFHEVILNNEYSVVAKRECAVFSVNLAELKDRPEGQEVLGLLEEMMKIRIREISAHNTILIQRTTRDKIREYFNLLSRRMLTREFELPMSYTEMAVYLNADRAAMTRELSLLEKEGFIEKKGHKIRLLW